MSTMPVSIPPQQQQPHQSAGHQQQSQAQQPPASSTPSSQTSSVPKKITRYPSKQVSRPFPKGDISVDLQKKAQDLLLTAAKNYAGYNPFNLELIAVSFEHKVFTESTTREEYIRKIKQKLNEWHYTETSNPPTQQGGKPSSPTAVRSSSMSEGSSGHKKSISGSMSKSPKDKARTRPSPPAQARAAVAPSPPAMGMPTLNTAMNRSPQSANVQPTYNMGAPGSAHQNPTTAGQRPPPLQSGPTTPPSMLSFSPISPPSNANFVTIFDPSFIDNFDLNDPGVRGEWIAAVRDNIYAEVLSGGNPMGGYPQPPGSAGSQRNSLVGLPESAMDLDADSEFKYIPSNMSGPGHQRNATGGSGGSNNSGPTPFGPQGNGQRQQQWIQNSHPGIGVSHGPGDMYGMNGGHFNGGGFNGHVMNEWFDANAQP